MRHTRPISLLLALLLLVSNAPAQTGDWQAVKNLAGGIKLKIKLKQGHTFGHCEFMGATEDALACDYPALLRDNRAQYRRDNIKAVYLVHNARAIGFGIGAGAGAVIGAATTPGPVPVRGLLALVDASILGGLGYFFGMVLDPFFHGKAVYLSSNPPIDGNRAYTPMPKNQNTNQPADNAPCLRDGVTLQCVTPETVTASSPEPVSDR
jgi:hypothetical protein